MQRFFVLAGVTGLALGLAVGCSSGGGNAPGHNSSGGAAGADGGGAGGAGTGGTGTGGSGTGGTAGTGTGGTAGAGTGGAGAGGTGGTGAGGSGTGGAAGSGTGGNAGAAGAAGAASDAGVGCAINSNACADCMLKNCNSETQACLTNTQCKAQTTAYDQCVCTAQDTNGNVQSCNNTFKNGGGGSAIQLVKCEQQNCATECGA